MNRYLEPRIRNQFVSKAVRSNRILMKVIGTYGIVTQVINLARVLFWSQTGLRSLNNRIYFGFYTMLLGLSVIFLLAGRLMQGLPAEKSYRIQMVLASLMVVLNTIFGMYDIHQSVSVGKIGTVTMLVAFAALPMMEPLYAVVNLVLSYGVLLLFLSTLKDAGAVFNYALVALLSMVIYYARIDHIRVELLQENKIESMNRVLEETEEKFLLTNEQYELLLQKGRLIAFEWNIRTDTVRFTHAWKEIFDAPQRIENIKEYIENAPILKRRQKDEIFQCMKNARRKLAYQKKDLFLPVKTGEERWFELQLALQCDKEGSPVLGVGLMFDIMDQKSRIIELQKELLMDNFTKTLNKTALESYAARRLHEMGPNERLGMLVLDMDDFKNINDTYGHLCGDYVLVQLGELMNTLAPGRTRVGRLGGDEFGAILDLSNESGAAEDYAARLIQEVANIRWGNQDLPAACSIGIASCSGGTSYPALYAAADKALYQAKHLGKSCYAVAPPIEAPEDGTRAPAKA